MICPRIRQRGSSRSSQQLLDGFSSSVLSSRLRLIRGHSPALVSLLTIYCLISTALAVFSVIAGLKLWLVRPGAVRFVRSWLWTYLVANLAYFVIWLTIGKSPQSVTLAEMGWYHVVGPIASFALWCLYLEHSRRVRTTYPFA
jgi:urea transporter